MMYIFFTRLSLCLAVAPRPGLLGDALIAVPETDDDRLNQALILVDILKSEYLKLLRERSESVATSTSIIEQPTCAATTAHSTAIETSTLTREQNNETLLSRPNADWQVFRGHPHNPGPVYPWGWPMPGTTVVANRFYDIMPQPVQPQYPNMFPLRRRPFRRNFPDYSYYYGPYRRSEYYDENHEETTRGIPEIVTTNTAVSKKRLSIEKTTTRLSADISQRRFYSPGRRSYDQNRRQSDNVAKEKYGTETNGTNTKLTSPNATNPNVTDTNRTITNATNTNWTQITKVHTVKTKATTLVSKAVWPAFRFKTTLRIFLENSTPLPIPLPENNAFCFTNPNNALCRSP